MVSNKRAFLNGSPPHLTTSLQRVCNNLVQQQFVLNKCVKGLLYSSSDMG